MFLLANSIETHKRFTLKGLEVWSLICSEESRAEVAQRLGLERGWRLRRRLKSELGSELRSGSELRGGIEALEEGLEEGGRPGLGDLLKVVRKRGHDLVHGVALVVLPERSQVGLILRRRGRLGLELLVARAFVALSLSLFNLKPQLLVFCLECLHPLLQNPYFLVQALIYYFSLSSTLSSALSILNQPSKSQ
jgi:hypothetical protein